MQDIRLEREGSLNTAKVCLDSWHQGDWNIRVSNCSKYSNGIFGTQMKRSPKLKVFTLEI